MIKNELLSNFKEKNKKYCLMQIWDVDNDSNNYLTLILTDFINYWSSKYSKNQVEKSSNLSDFDIDSIKHQFIQAFSQNIGANYSIKITGLEKITLELKKVIEDEIKVKIASFDLKIVDDPSPIAERIFDYSINKINGLDNKVENLESEVKRLLTEKNGAIEALKESVEQKETIEFDLYSKFVEVLNEKKAKIRELTQMDD